MTLGQGSAFPQECDTLAPVVEYLMDAEIGECGLSAHELQTGYSLLQERDVTLAPFMVPKGTARTDLVARLFTNFREMAGILNRHKEQVYAKQIDAANQTRHLRQLIPGEIVFRRMPSKASPAKHLLGEPRPLTVPSSENQQQAIWRTREQTYR